VALAALEDPFYYLANFRRVLAWLEQRYLDVLEAEELSFIQRFETLPQPSQALLVRMIMRKGEMFRASRLDYAEIGCPKEAAHALLSSGYVVDCAPLTLQQVCDVLLKPEIVTCFAAHLAKPSLPKPQLLLALADHEWPAQSFQAWCPALADTLYCLTVQALCDRLRLLFFGNLRQGWTEFVLADLGVYRYESVQLDPESRGLTHRDDVVAGLALHACSEAMEAGEPCHEIHRQLLAVTTDKSWLQSRRQKLLFRLGYACERQQDLEQALTVYRSCEFAQARARIIRVLELRGEYAEALALAEQASLAPLNPAEAQQLPRMLPRLRRHLGLPAERKRSPAKIERLDLTVALCEQRLSVEQRVAVSLQTEDGPVHYVENTLFNSLFGLLCWQAIFAPLPGAFFHPFQNGPADLHQPDFRQRRSALFDACLGQLDDGRYKSTIRQTWREKQGVQSPFVHWGMLDETLLERALACIPAEHLKHCFDRVLEDVKANRTGMPDLIQFWPAERRYLMIEVKGPGDRLQDNQLRWLDFCARHALPVQVCYVEWAGQTA
jgi:tetratricopeptide (TPR) repeat protein